MDNYEYQRMRGGRMLHRRSNRDNLMESFKPQVVVKRKKKMDIKQVNVKKHVENTVSAKSNNNNIHIMIAQNCALPVHIVDRTCVDVFDQIPMLSKLCAKPDNDICENIDEQLSETDIFKVDNNMMDTSIDIEENGVPVEPLTFGEEANLVVEAMVNKVVGEEVCDNTSSNVDNRTTRLCHTDITNHQSACDTQSNRQVKIFKKDTQCEHVDEEQIGTPVDNVVLEQEEWLAIVHGHTRPSCSADKDCSTDNMPDSGTCDRGQSIGLTSHRQASHITKVLIENLSLSSFAL